MTHAIRFHQTGGPDVLRWEKIEVGEPGPGEVRIRHHAIGLNFIDTYQRSGLYPMPMPLILGGEGAGVIEAVGPGVAADRVGERVWVWNGQWQRPHGTAATHIALPAGQAVALPAAVSFDEGACLGIPALTALHGLVTAGGAAAGRRGAGHRRGRGGGPLCGADGAAAGRRLSSFAAQAAAPPSATKCGFSKPGLP